MAKSSDDDIIQHNPAISELLNRIQFSLSKPIDFTRTDPETTETKVRLLTASAIYFNILAVTDFRRTWRTSSR